MMSNGDIKEYVDACVKTQLKAYMYDKLIEDEQFKNEILGMIKK